MFDPTNPNSALRLELGSKGHMPWGDGSIDNEVYTDPETGRVFREENAIRARYLDNKAAAEAKAQEKETLAKRAAYSTQFDAISADARGIRQRYAQSLGYNPYFLR